MSEKTGRDGYVVEEGWWFTTVTDTRTGQSGTGTCEKYAWNDLASQARDEKEEDRRSK